MTPPVLAALPQFALLAISISPMVLFYPQPQLSRVRRDSHENVRGGCSFQAESTAWARLREGSKRGVLQEP